MADIVDMGTLMHTPHQVSSGHMACPEGSRHDAHQGLAAMFHQCEPFALPVEGPGRPQDWTVHPICACRDLPVLQAADDPGRAGRHIGAELLAVLEAGLGQGHVEADVAGGVLHDLHHPRSAGWRLNLLPGCKVES